MALTQDQLQSALSLLSPEVRDFYLEVRAEHEGRARQISDDEIVGMWHSAWGLRPSDEVGKYARKAAIIFARALLARQPPSTPESNHEL